MALAAARMAVEDAKLEATQLAGPRTAVVLGTTNGLPLRARLMGRQMGGQGEPPAHGATMTLAWAPQDAHVLPRASGP